MIRSLHADKQTRKNVKLCYASKAHEYKILDENFFSSYLLTRTINYFYLGKFSSVREYRNY